MSRLRRTGQAPAIVDMEVIDVDQGTAHRGRARRRSRWTRRASSSCDGSRVEPDVVICATGYSRVLEPLVGHLGVLDEREVPRVRRRHARRARAPLHRLRAPRPGGIGYAGKESRGAARAIARELAAR